MARLVIIDDESHITEILTRFFRDKGHAVLGFTRAEEALAHLTASPIDLVITDIAMMGLSGIELLAKMKTLGLDVPVIVTTGNPSHSSAVQALRGGAFDYVVKPFHLDEIAERAEKALSLKRVKDENVLYSKLVSLHSISRVTAEAASMEELSTKVTKLGTRLTGSDSGWYWVATSQGSSTDMPVLYPDAASREQHALLVKLGRSTAEKVNEDVTDGEEAWYLSVPVQINAALHGVLIFRRMKPAVKYDAVDLEVFNQLAATYALGIRALGLFPKALATDRAEEGKALESWARLIGQMVDLHCPGYESKGDRVEALGTTLMQAMQWPPAMGESWPLVCRIYDIAKVRVPQKLLETKDILDESELEFVQAQAAWASEQVKSIPGAETCAKVLQDFQESFDGSGQPKGIRGTAIAPLARLLAVADAYVSMRSARPYRDALDGSEAMQVMQRGAGKRFDPEIVAALHLAQV